MIRLGLIGYGYWGPNLLRNFAASDQFQVMAIAERRTEAGQNALRVAPSAQLFEDASELLRRSDIDAVAIATPSATHYSLVRDALESGKHVLVEKPMCTSSDEGQDLIARAERAGRVLMVDHTFLFTGAVQTISEAVRSGALGKICYFDSMRVNLGLFQPDVNCLWDLAPHDLSVIDHLINGDLLSMDVSGYCHVNAGLPDMVYLTLHYDDKVVAHFNLSWMSPVKVRRFAIGGTKQMLIWDDLDQDQKIRIYNSGVEFHAESERETIMPAYRIGDIYSPRVSRQEALAGVVNHFAKVIQGQEVSIMDGRRGLRVVQVLEKAQKQLDERLNEVATRQTGGQ